MLRVKPFRQTDSSRCGPASLKMVLGYHGLELTETELCRLTNHTFELGCSNEDMRKAAATLGFKTSMYDHANWGDIEYWLQRDIPIIVDWMTSGYAPGTSDTPIGHSSVVIGLDSVFIHLLDPEFGWIRTIKREEFFRVWFDWCVDKPFITCWEDMIIRELLAIYK